MQFEAAQPKVRPAAPRPWPLPRMLARIVASMRFDRRHVTVMEVPANGPRPGHAPGTHVHETGQLAVSLSGALFCQMGGGDVQQFPPGHLVLIPGGMPHVSLQGLMQHKSRRGRWFSMVMSFGEAAAATNDRGKMQERILSAEERHDWRKWLGHEPADVFRRVTDAMAANAPWCDAYLESSLRLFLTALQASLRDDEERQAGDGDAVSRTVQFLNRRFSDASLSMAGIAAAVGLSRHSLETLFREATGTTVWQRLVEIRLVHAHGLLTHSSFSVKEIAARTGWSNQLYFSSAFRRRFGHSPSDVRRSLLPLAMPAPRRK